MNKLKRHWRVGAKMNSITTPYKYGLYVHCTFDKNSKSFVIYALQYWMDSKIRTDLGLKAKIWRLKNGLRPPKVERDFKKVLKI